MDAPRMAPLRLVLLGGRRHWHRHGRDEFHLFLDHRGLRGIRRRRLFDLGGVELLENGLEPVIEGQHLAAGFALETVEEVVLLLPQIGLLLIIFSRRLAKALVISVSRSLSMA